MGGRGCAIPKQENKSRKKKTQEPGNMIQNRSKGNSQDDEERNRWNESSSAGLNSKQSRFEQEDKRLPEENLQEKRKGFYLFIFFFLSGFDGSVYYIERNFTVLLKCLGKNQ